MIDLTSIHLLDDDERMKVDESSFKELVRLYHPLKSGKWEICEKSDSGELMDHAFDGLMVIRMICGVLLKLDFESLSFHNKSLISFIFDKLQQSDFFEMIEEFPKSSRFSAQELSEELRKKGLVKGKLHGDDTGSSTDT